MQGSRLPEMLVEKVGGAASFTQSGVHSISYSFPSDYRKHLSLSTTFAGKKTSEASQAIAPGPATSPERAVTLFSTLQHTNIIRVSTSSDFKHYFLIS